MITVCMDYKPPSFTVKTAEFVHPSADMIDLVASLLEFKPSARSSVRHALHQTLAKLDEDSTCTPQDSCVDTAMESIAPNVDCDHCLDDDWAACDLETRRAVPIGIGTWMIRRASSDAAVLSDQRRRRFLSAQPPACRHNAERTSDQMS